MNLVFRIFDLYFNKIINELKLFDIGHKIKDIIEALFFLQDYDNVMFVLNSYKNFY